MKPSKYLSDPTFIDGVNRLKEGKINRAELASEWGISLSTLSTRFRYAGLLKELKSTKQTGKAHNDHHFVSDPDNVKRYEPALAELAANSHLSVRKVNKKYPELTYKTLLLMAKERGNSSAAEKLKTNPAGEEQNANSPV